MTNRTVFIRGEQVDLVILGKADAATTHHWFNDESITRFLTRGSLPMTEDQAADYYSQAASNHSELVLGIWHQEEQTLIGTTGLHDIDYLNQTAELGIVIGVHSYHSQGIGREVVELLCTHAFHTLNLRHVLLRVYGNNAGAIACYQGCGFKEVGRLPEFIFKAGAWQDVVYMLLRQS